MGWECDMVSGVTCAGESYSAAPGETQPSSLIPQSLVIYPIQKLNWENEMSLHIFGWQYFNLDPVFHWVASWRHTRAKKGVSHEWGSTSRSRERTGVLFLMVSTTQFWWYQDWKHGSLVLPLPHLSTWRNRGTLWDLQSAVITVLCFCVSLRILNHLCFYAYVSRLSNGLQRINLIFSL